MNIASLCRATAWLTAIFHLSPARAQNEWRVADSINVDAVLVDVIKDPHRPFLYAVDRIDSKVLFINLKFKTIEKIYVGKLPSSLAMDDAGNRLYVANHGVGAGTPADYQIAVVDLETHAKTHHFLTNSQPNNLVMGREGRLYYNAGSWENGNIHSAGGLTGIVDTSTGIDIGRIGNYTIKSRMVVNDDKTKLYGQYVYTGNLGEMGVFDIENKNAFRLDRHPYSPYPYGWDYNNYSISANGDRLAYGYVLFNANNLIIQYGAFPELIHALNADGTIAFGVNSVWDTSTFATTGSATKLFQHGLSSSVMFYDSANGSLYAFSPKDYSIKRLQSDGDGGVGNRQPVANAGADQRLESDAAMGAFVALDGTGSMDPDGDELDYEWRWSGWSAFGPTANVFLPFGVHEISLVVWDGLVESSPEKVLIEVVDTKPVPDVTPPTISVSASHSALWPPNNKMEKVRVSIQTMDDADPSPLVTLESIEVSGGKSSDYEIINNEAILLRKSEGNSYVLNYHATDKSGNTARARVVVRVARD